MVKKSKDNICISITESEIKAVLVRGSGKNAKITSVVVKDISNATPDSLPKVIASALKPVKIKSAEVSLIASPMTITTKNIEIPSTNKEEIQSIVSLQAGRHTPFARDEIQIGYVNIGVHKNNYSKVLLVIVNKNALKEQIANLSKAGFKVSSVYFAPESVSSYYAEALNLKGQGSTVGLIDIGEYATEFILISDGVVATSRNIPIGKTSIASDGDSAKDKLIEEISKTVESSQAEEIVSIPGKYILSSDDKTIRQIQLGIQEKMNAEIEIVPYIDKIHASKNVIKSIASNYSQHTFLDVIAPAVYGSGSSIDLLPEEIKIQESIALQGKEIFKIAVLSFVLLALVAGLFGAKIFYASNTLTKYEEKLEENKDKVAMLEEISDRTKIVKKFLDERMVSLEVIDNLYKEIPKEIYLTNLMIQDENTIKVEGISEISSLIHKLVTQLGQSDFFAKVDLIATNSRKDRGKDVHAFEIMIQLMASEEEQSNLNNPETEE